MSKRDILIVFIYRLNKRLILISYYKNIDVKETA